MPAAAAAGVADGGTSAAGWVGTGGKPVPPPAAPPPAELLDSDWAPPFFEYEAPSAGQEDDELTDAGTGGGAQSLHRGTSAAIVDIAGGALDEEDEAPSRCACMAEGLKKVVEGYIAFDPLRLEEARRFRATKASSFSCC